MRVSRGMMIGGSVAATAVILAGLGIHSCISKTVVQDNWNAEVRKALTSKIANVECVATIQQPLISGRFARYKASPDVPGMLIKDRESMLLKVGGKEEEIEVKVGKRSLDGGPTKVTMAYSTILAVGKEVPECKQ